MTKLDRMIKVAGGGEKGSSKMLQKLLYPAAAGVLGLGVTHGVLPYMKKKKQLKQKNEAWSQIQKLVPDLAKQKGIKEHFDSIHDMTPKVMSHPTFAIPVLRQTADYGTEGIPLQMLQMATSTEFGSGGQKAGKPDKLALPVTLANMASKLT